MERNLVSIIVPCYNVEKFLNDCFESLQKQTYKNLEIIFVNDGSTDKTLAMLQSFCTKNNNAKLINQSNQGLSGARNTGLANANGEYVYFMDSDDFVSSNAIEIMLDNIKKYDCDFVCIQSKWIKEKISVNNVKLKNEKKYSPKFYHGTDNIMSLYFARRLNFTVWSKLYKMSILKTLPNFPNLFNVNTKYCEDMEFNINYITKSNNIVVIPLKLYFYRQRKNSLIHSKFNPSKLSVLYAFEKAKTLDKTIYINAPTYINSHHCVVALELLFRIAKSNYNDAKSIALLYNDFQENKKYLRKGKLNPFYLKLIPCVSPLLTLKFKKYLKKEKA